MAVGGWSVWLQPHVMVTSISDRIRRTGSVLQVFPPVHWLHRLESVGHHL